MFASEQYWVGFFCSGNVTRSLTNQFIWMCCVCWAYLFFAAAKKNIRCCSKAYKLEIYPVHRIMLNERQHTSVTVAFFLSVHFSNRKKVNEIFRYLAFALLLPSYSRDHYSFSNVHLLLNKSAGSIYIICEPRTKKISIIGSLDTT